MSTPPTFAPYPAYRPSGVKWLGDIPKHWEVVRASNAFQVIDERSKTGDEELLSVSENHGVRKRSESTVSMFMAESYVGHKLCYPGDLVINSLWAWSRGLGITNHHGIVSTAYSVFRPNHSKYDKAYLNYLLRLDEYVAHYFVLSKGVWISRLQLSDWSFLRIGILTPPLEEQTRIAAFLDEKTAQIDQAIAQKERLIELLKEKRQVMVYQAVTRGLNPDAPMKPSGIEWLGDIPAHWEVRKLKHLVDKVGSGVTPRGGGTTYKEEGIPLLRSQNIHFDRIDLSDVAYITEKVHNEMSNSKVKDGDVLLNITGGSLGRCFYIKSGFGEANVNQHVCILRPSQAILSKYLYFLFSSQIGQQQVFFDQTGSGREGLSGHSIKNFDFPIPRLEEQQIICNYLESLQHSTNSIIENLTGTIQKLKEFRTILIHEAVTGKINVTSTSVSTQDIAREHTPQEWVTLIAAYALARDYEQDQIKMMKYVTVGLYLTQIISKAPYSISRHRFGPNNPDLERDIEQGLEKAQLAQVITETNNKKRYKKRNAITFRDKLFDSFSETERNALNQVVAFFKGKGTWQIEKYATLFFAWNDLLLVGKPHPSDREIVQQAYTHWHPDKTKYSLDEWQEALAAMKAEQFVPLGNGKTTILQGE